MRSVQSQSRFEHYLNRRSLVTAVLLVLLGVGGRLLLQDEPNVETIMLVTLLGASLLGGPWACTVGLVTVALSDIVIGNNATMLFTWSAWSMIGAFGLLVRRWHRTKEGGERPYAIRHALQLTGAGIGATLFFYLWTNFGVWAQGWYPQTLEGLMKSYINALPFLWAHMKSTVTIVPVGSALFLTIYDIVIARLDSKAYQRHNPTYESHT